MDAEQPAFDRRMLEALVCPQTHTTLIYDAQKQELVSKAAGLALPDPRRHSDHAAVRGPSSRRLKVTKAECRAGVSVSRHLRQPPREWPPAALSVER